MKFKMRILIATLLAMSLICGCSKNYTFEGGDITTVNVDDVVFSTEKITEIEEIEYDIINDETLIFDRAGNLVSVPAQINTIVSTSSSAVEILIGLGFGDEIVMANTASKDIGGINSGICTIDVENINVNELIALAPDVLIVTNDSNNAFEQLKALGTEVVLMPESTTIKSIKDDISFLAEYTQTVSIGEEFIKDIDDAVNEVTSRLAEIDIAYRPKVYFEMDYNPELYTCGNNTIVDDIITLCGGSNIYTETAGKFYTNFESVISANPDVIITSLDNDGYNADEIKKRIGWGEINAVKNDQVYHVYPGYYDVPSQKIVHGINDIAKAIYPELFADLIS